MPKTRKERRRDGGGPWQFEAPDIAPGESWTLDFRNMEYGGTNGYFRKWLPFDAAQVTNPSNATVNVNFNGIYDQTVVPNAVESYSDIEISRVTLSVPASESDTATGARVAVEVTPYGADERAREQAGQPWVQRALNDLVPGGLPGGGGK